jgi:hypothetical protein
MMSPSSSALCTQQAGPSRRLLGQAPGNDSVVDTAITAAEPSGNASVPITRKMASYVTETQIGSHLSMVGVIDRATVVEGCR